MPKSQEVSIHAYRFAKTNMTQTFSQAIAFGQTVCKQKGPKTITKITCNCISESSVMETELFDMIPIIVKFAYVSRIRHIICRSFISTVTTLAFDWRIIAL